MDEASVAPAHRAPPTGTGPELPAGVRIRLLGAEEAERLGQAIRIAYGDTYDTPWVYDAAEVARRISLGLLVSCIAETGSGELLCHAGMSFHSPHDRVGHSGQAVTLPAARGHHLFTAVKRHLAQVAAARGLVGIYSEATAAHPYSQRANVDLGAHETGFALGWIPGSVANNAARPVPAPDPGGAAEGAAPRTPRRQSVALFYLRTNAEPPHPAYAPAAHRDVVHETITTCRLHARLADPPVRGRLERRSTVHSHVLVRHGLAVLTVTEPGADLTDAVETARRRLFGEGLAAIYVDLPLDLHATARVAGHLEALGVSYAGIFPNTRQRGDVLRFQSLNGVVIDPGDLAVASEHGRRLLDYVLGDLAATGHRVVPAR